MKKWLIGVAVLLMLGLGAALVVPGFMDWNPYRDDVAAEVEALTGRRLDIAGDLRLRLVPSPKLSVEDVRLTATTGERSEDLLHLDALDVSLSLRALISGKIRVERVTLRRPVVIVRRDADGRLNWMREEEIATEASGARDGAAPPIPASGDDGGPPIDVQFDQVEIIDGTIFYRDAIADIDERFDDVNMTVAAERLEGPFIGLGSAVVQKMPLTFAIDLGRRGRDGRRPIDAEITLAPNEASARLKGAIDLGDTMGFAGDVALEGGNLAAFWRKVQPRPLPGFLAQPFTVGGKLSAGPERAGLEDLAITLGDTRASGHLSVTMPSGENETPAHVDVALVVERLDIDAWMAMHENATAKETEKIAPAPAPGKASGGGEPEGPRPDENALLGLEAVVDLSVEAMVVRGGLVREAQAYAEIADGELTLHQVAARLPGGSGIALFGFAEMTAGQPRFDGELQIDAPDLRGALSWLDLDPAGISSSRLRTLSLRSKVGASFEAAELRDIQLVVDGSTLTGGLRFDWGKPLRLHADLALDRLNVDAYLPLAGGGSEIVATEKRPADAGEGEEDPLDLDDLDADVILRVDEMTVHDLFASDVLIDGRIADGDLRLRELSVGEIAGVSLTIAGVIDTVARKPAFSGVRFGVRTGDVAAFFRAVGGSSPDAVASIGDMTASGTVNGDVFSPQVEVTVGAVGGAATFTGDLRLAGPPQAQGRIRARHQNWAQLIAAFAPSYRPRGHFGLLEVAADVRGSQDAVTVAGLSGRVNDTAIAGNIELALAGVKPRATVNLDIGSLALDPFLPSDGRAESDRGSLWPASHTVIPHGSRRPDGVAVVPVAATVDARWSRQPLGLSALAAFDADIGIKAETVSVEHYALKEATVSAALAEGRLSVQSLKGSLLGGPLEGSGWLDGRGIPSAEILLRAEDIRMSQILQSSTATGRIRADIDVASSGHSVADLVSNLGGSVRAALTDANPAEGLFGAVHGPLLEFPGLGGGLLRAAGAPAEASASWIIDGGSARSSDIRFTSPLGAGEAEGTLDLAEWWTENTGTFRLSRAAAAAFKAGLFGLTLPEKIPFRVQGPLDRPAVTWELTKLSLRPEGPEGTDSPPATPPTPNILGVPLPGGGDHGRVPALPTIKDILDGGSR